MYYGVLIAMTVWLILGAVGLAVRERWDQLDYPWASFLLLVFCVAGIVFGSLIELVQGTL